MSQGSSRLGKKVCFLYLGLCTRLQGAEIPFRKESKMAVMMETKPTVKYHTSTIFRDFFPSNDYRKHPLLKILSRTKLSVESCEFASFQHCISRLIGGSLEKERKSTHMWHKCNGHQHKNAPTHMHTNKIKDT